MTIISDNGIRGLYTSNNFCHFDGLKYYNNRHCLNTEQCADEAEEIIKSVKRAVPKKKQDKEFLKQIKKK